MTTGDPWWSGGAMKPLPTLTKPLRSVDLADQGARRGAARAHRLLHRARRRGGGGGDGGARAGRAPTARSSAATTSTTPSRRSRRTGSGSDGGADRTARPLGLHRLHGRRQVQLGAVGGRGARHAARSTPTASWSASWASRSRRSSTARARPRSARARRRWCCACWSAADGGVVALGGGAAGSERVREALRDHTVVHLEVEPEEAWRRASGKGRPLARDRGRFDQLHADRAAVYDSVADAVIPPSRRDTPRRALPALLALRDSGPDAKLVWARASDRATTRCSWAAGCSTRASSTRATAAASR